MAKRFIDSGLFDDPWFMDLSKDGKILWIYMITKCDHAGVIEFNERLCKFQSGINDLDKPLKELHNRYVRVNEQYIFIPKFVLFQYPNFPNSNVRAQQSAIERLNKLGLLNNGSLTVSKPLDKAYEHEHGNGYGSGKEDEYVFSKFYDFEIEQSKDKDQFSHYMTYVEFLYGNNPLKRPLNKLLRMSDQITYDNFISLIARCKVKEEKLTQVTLNLENYNKKTYKSFFLTLNNWTK